MLQIFSFLFGSCPVALSCAWQAQNYVFPNKSGKRYPAQVLINDKALEEFIKLYAEEFGEHLSADEGREVASNLLDLYLLLLQPTPKELAAMEEKEP